MKKRSRTSATDFSSKTKRLCKTILRYPGGKARSVKLLAQFLPPDVKELCSPFVGGAAFELYCANQLNIQVHCSDLFAPLINFWACLKKTPQLLQQKVQNLHLVNKEAFHSLRARLLEWLQSGAPKSDELINLEMAAIFFALNRCSFSGTTCSGGFSKEASEKRFNQSSIDKLQQLNLQNLRFDCLSFEAAIDKQPAEMLLFLDPPYYLGHQKSKLYGVEGNLHKNFPHKELHALLQQRSKWILCYNNCPEIKTLYSDFHIIPADWSYGMSAASRRKKQKQCSRTTFSNNPCKEVIILSNDIWKQLAEVKDKDLVQTCI